MLSIITAVHNKLQHNKLFLESLKKYTYNKFELIVIDNASQDGSGEFFEENGAVVIRNEKNLCYPESMNLGFKYSKGEYICLLNNDVYLSKHWDKYIIDAMEDKDIKVASPGGIEKIPDRKLAAELYDRWYAIGLKRHVNSNYLQLNKLINLMYGDWDTFTRNIFDKFYPLIIPGIYGCAVFIERRLFEELNGLDIRLQEADWDLALRLEELKNMGRLKHGAMVVTYTFVHHFIRATLKSKPQPFACNHEKLKIEEKWGDLVYKLWPTKEEVTKPAFLEHTYRKIKRNIMRIYYNFL
ncbi:MAG: glycosyltransferase [bacterium]|nr:glycosyltransferase [bacterium]